MRLAIRAVGTWLRPIGIDLVMVAAFGAVLLALSVAYGAHLTWLQSSVMLPLASLLVLVGVAVGTRVRSRRRGAAGDWRQAAAASLVILRDWLPLTLVLLVYENLHEYTYLLRPTTLDADLRAVDELLFGLEPTLLLDRVTSPWLTEAMTAAYGLYFVYPAGLLIALYASGHRRLYRELGLALSTACYLGFLGYVTVPAMGPRYFMAAEFHSALTGPWLTARAAAAWNHLESVQRDCFPSLHTGLTTIFLIFLWRARRLWPRGRLALAACVPLVVALWVSTIYLRYHWAVDVLAGWTLGLVVSALAPVLLRWYGGEACEQRPVAGGEPAA